MQKLKFFYLLVFLFFLQKTSSGEYNYLRTNFNVTINNNNLREYAVTNNLNFSQHLQFFLNEVRPVIDNDNRLNNGVAGTTNYLAFGFYKCDNAMRRCRFYKSRTRYSSGTRNIHHNDINLGNLYDIQYEDNVGNHCANENIVQDFQPRCNINTFPINGRIQLPNRFFLRNYAHAEQALLSHMQRVGNVNQNNPNLIQYNEDEFLIFILVSTKNLCNSNYCGVALRKVLGHENTGLNSLFFGKNYPYRRFITHFGVDNYDNNDSFLGGYPDDFDVRTFIFFFYSGLDANLPNVQGAQLYVSAI